MYIFGVILVIIAVICLVKSDREIKELDEKHRKKRDKIIKYIQNNFLTNEKEIYSDVTKSLIVGEYFRSWTTHIFLHLSDISIAVHIYDFFTLSEGKGNKYIKKVLEELDWKSDEIEVSVKISGTNIKEEYKNAKDVLKFLNLISKMCLNRSYFSIKKEKEAEDKKWELEKIEKENEILN